MLLNYLLAFPYSSAKKLVQYGKFNNNNKLIIIHTVMHNIYIHTYLIIALMSITYKSFQKIFPSYLMLIQFNGWFLNLLIPSKNLVPALYTHDSFFFFFFYPRVEVRVKLSKCWTSHDRRKT